MPVKLIVRNTADPSFSEEHVFRQDRITIGRDAGNLLPLPDDRRIVSKQHAEIRGQAGQLEVVDLGSKNYTYVNEQRVPSNKATALRHGDVLRIGEFEIQVAEMEPEAAELPAPHDDRTVFAINPFWEQAEELKQLLRQVKTIYGREVPGRRREALMEAFDEALADERDGDVVDLLRDVLGGAATEDVSSEPGLPDRPSSDRPPPADSVPAAEPPRRQRPPSYWQQFAGSAPVDEMQREARSPSEPQVLPNGAEPDEVIGLLLDYIAELLGIPWQFRHEFIGQTIVQSEASSVLYDGDAERLARFLLDPTLPDEEADRRRALLADAADALRRHQVAMLDGYKAAVREGVQRFLDEIDLDVIREEISDQAQWYERPLIRLRALGALEKRVGELRNEEWTVIERRVFRPSFIKAYLARMTSS